MNKLFYYLYLRRPIINAYLYGYDIVRRYYAGVTVPAESTESLSEANSALAPTGSENQTEIRSNGVIMSREKHEYRKSSATLHDLIIPLESAH